MTSPAVFEQPETKRHGARGFIAMLGDLDGERRKERARHLERSDNQSLLGSWSIATFDFLRRPCDRSVSVVGTSYLR